MSFPFSYTIWVLTLVPLFLFTLFISLSKALSTVENARKYKKTFILTIFFLILWSLFMFYLGITGFFASSTLPTGPVATGIFMLIGLVCFFFLKTFKQFILSIPLHWLIIPQIFRFMGGIFIMVTLSHQLPLYWGMGVGWGDFITGITAPFIVYAVFNKSHNWKNYVIAWSTFGLFDIVHAIVVATLITPSPFQLFHPVPGIEATQYFPLIVIVVVARPMVSLLHIFILAKYFQMSKLVSKK